MKFFDGLTGELENPFLGVFLQAELVEDMFRVVDCKEVSQLERVLEDALAKMIFS